MSSSNQEPTSSRSTDGAKGLKLSRYLTLRLRVFCMDGERGSPRIERAPSARGPYSMRPCIQPTALPSASACAVASMSSSSPSSANFAPAALSALSIAVSSKDGPR